MLTVENQTDYDVKMVAELIDDHGEHTDPWTWGTVPAGQTVELLYGIDWSSDLLLLLKAEDPSGTVIWQHIWTTKELLELEKVGWEIVISPQTDSPL
ncbi:hypothetical protein ACFLW2_04510 [Chloroflexota bacterium]